ncbi:MAG: 3'(2'),5'-bisphosphate nucleotidase CysQ family protein [Burkholderiaceae bacterium]
MSPYLYLNQAYLHSLAAIAFDAGQAIMQVYDQPELWRVENKADGSPVTLADLRANQIILNGLAHLSPEIPVLSEESPWQGGGAATYWAVDPLDGTKEFIKRNGEFTVNIALVINGVARLGVIGAPALGTIWAGIRGDDRDLVGQDPDKGAPVGARSWLGRLQTPSESGGKSAGESGSEPDDSPFERLGPWTELPILPRGAMTPTVPTLHAFWQAGEAKPIRVLGSRSHAGEEFPDWLNPYLARARPKACGSSMKFCLIAQGDADLYVRMGPTCIWDTAAGHAILSAAGGSVIHAQTRRELTYPNPQAALNPAFVAYLTKRP